MIVVTLKEVWIIVFVLKQILPRDAVVVDVVIPSGIEVGFVFHTIKK